METKEQLVDNVKEWMKLDNELVQKQNEIKELKKRKKNITDDLLNVMKTNSIECFDINGGSLLYKKNVILKSLNTKTLMISLKKYYESINKDDSLAETLTKHIMDSREKVVKESIRRKVDKI